MYIFGFPDPYPNSAVIVYEGSGHAPLGTYVNNSQNFPLTFHPPPSFSADGRIKPKKLSGLKVGHKL